jgi:hypothetical protein
VKWFLLLVFVSRFAGADILTTVRPDDPSLPRLVGYGPVNSLCLKAGFQYFGTHELEKFERRDDVCFIPEEEVPAEIRAAIQQLGELNHAAAKALGTTFERLFPEGIAVELRGMEMGWLGSTAGTGSIRMGVFSDWPSSKGEAINSGVYVHELGHLVRNAKAPELPLRFVSLMRRTLTIEGSADALALATLGEIITPNPTLPECVLDARRISTQDTFRRETDFFDKYPIRQLQACCEKSLIADSVNTRLKSVCGSRILNQKLLPPDLSPFNPGGPEGYEITSYPGDDHQYGIPLNALFLSVAAKTGKTFGEILLNSYRESASAPAEPYRCNIRMAPERSVDVTTESLEPVWEAALSSVDSQFSSQLYAHHGLSLGLRVDRNSQIRGAASDARKKIRALMEAETDSFFSTKNKCYWYMIGDPVVAMEADCAVRCLSRPL